MKWDKYCETLSSNLSFSIYCRHANKLACIILRGRCVKRSYLPCSAELLKLAKAPTVPRPDEPHLTSLGIGMWYVASSLGTKVWRFMQIHTKMYKLVEVRVWILSQNILFYEWWIKKILRKERIFWTNEVPKSEFKRNVASWIWN